MRLLGGAMVTLGVLAFWAPMATGGWSLALLSFPLDVELILMLAAVFFAIHLGRMPTAETWLGIISPFVATAGDILDDFELLMALIDPLRAEGAVRMTSTKS